MGQAGGWRRAGAWVALATTVGCANDAEPLVGISAGGTGVSASGGSTDTTGEPGTSTTGAALDSATSTGSENIFDVGQDPDVPTVDVCNASRDGQSLDACSDTAPPDAFEPDVQWGWTGRELTQSFVTPLVINLTDDDGNGAIDLCDTPDVVVVAAMDDLTAARIVVLSGDDGHEHFEIDVDVNFSVTPAVGDIDGDGLPEIVTAGGYYASPNSLVAFSHEGALLWTSAADPAFVDVGAVALHDLDADGDVEILLGNAVFDHAGTLLWTVDESPHPALSSLVTAADLDDDGDLEVVHGRSAYHHDGSVYYQTDLMAGFPHVADFDGDGAPEVVLTSDQGISRIEADGTVAFGEQRPTGDPADPLIWLKPATVHDFDGDGLAELATGSANHYAVYEIAQSGASIVWQADVLDSSGSAGGTAFDFDGDGRAEAMYADETNFFVYDDVGGMLLSTSRESVTGVEYPVVADVDNDGSAEIVIVSNTQDEGEPAVQVVRDVQDRWIQARRVWNQHTYHVTNVHEDGTIPTVETPAWDGLNTFRTNAQIENGIVCEPEG
ncbi:MAG: VCBS repeat-containing protein [Myxococcota bacterium]